MKKIFCLLVLVVFSYTLRINIGGSLQDNNDIFKEYKELKVGVITAAGVPSDAASVIRNMLRNGAKSAYRLELQGVNCPKQAYNLSLVKEIQELDAIYMTGGQPIDLHSCLFGGQRGAIRETTPVLEEIKKLKLVGGSSAGSLVQPKLATLTAGFPYSYDALVSGKVDYSVNGTEILRQGVLIDVHFSERGRQGRLHVFQQITGLKYAFGIDEDTSLITLENGVKKVIGKGGVYVIENIDKNNAIYHYLTEQDTISPNGEITFGSFKTPCELHNRRPVSSNSIFNANVFTTLAKQLVNYQEVFTFKSYQGTRNVVTVSMTKTESGFCGRYNNIEHISFKNLKINYHVSTSEKLGFSAEEYTERYYTEN